MDRQKRIHAWASDYCQSFNIVLETGRSGILLGAPGTGKTTLAVGILKHVLEKGGTGLYTTLMDMLARIKATYGKDAAESEQTVIQQLTSVDLLVVDEIGRSVDSSYETAQFFRLLDRRYRQVKPVILVTNMNTKDFSDFIGPSAVDRLREAGGVIHVFDWGSQRNFKIVKDDDES